MNKKVSGLPGTFCKNYFLMEVLPCCYKNSGLSDEFPASFVNLAAF